MEKGSIVKVVWWDAEDLKTTWADEDDIAEFGDKVYEVVSVGYLVRNTEKYVTISGDRGQDESYGATRKIPKGMVRSIETLEVRHETATT